MSHHDDDIWASVLPLIASVAPNLAWGLVSPYQGTATIAIRITNGKPRYTSNFTPATLTQDDDTALMWEFNGSVGQKWVKELSKNGVMVAATNARTVSDGVWIAPGSAAIPSISTAQSKFGGSSFYFPGSTATAQTLGTSTSVVNVANNFTIDFWMRQSSYNGSGGSRILSCVAEVSASTADAWEITSSSSYLGNQGRLSFIWCSGTTTNSVQTAVNTIALNTWYHVAIVKSGTTVTIYINGTSAASGTMSSVNAGTRPLLFGVINNPKDNNSAFNGYIDELRFSDIARWTSDFTPATDQYGSSYVAGPYWVATKPGVSAIDLSAWTTVSSLTFAGSTPAGTSLKFLLSLDGYATPLKYWNGSAWVASSYSMTWNNGAGTLTTTATSTQLEAVANTFAELQTGLLALNVSTASACNIVAILSTTNTANTPSLDALSFIMTEYKMLTPGVDFSVTYKNPTGSQTLTLTRLASGNATHVINYLP